MIFLELVTQIKKAALDAFENSKPVNVVFGCVVSENPIEIKVDQKLVLGCENLIFFDENVDLQVDQKIVLLRVQGGQKFVVLEPGTYDSVAPHNHDDEYLGIGDKAVDSDKLDGKDSTEFAGSSHNHDGDYATTIHNHDTEYSDISHNHVSEYADIIHNHDGDYASTIHNHDTEYSDISHNHDSEYLGISAKASDSDKLDGKDSTEFAGSSHNHDGDYASTIHNHDADYSDIAHNHDSEYLGISAKASDSDKLDGKDSTEFASSSHNHDGDYATTIHNHDADYSDIAHNHDSEYLGISAKASDSDKLDGRSGEDYFQAHSANGYEGMGVNGNTGNWIRTTVNGLIPYQAGGASNLGTSSWNFNNVYSKNFYENNVLLSAKYLGISAKAVDSDKLDGKDSELYIYGNRNNGAFWENGDMNTLDRCKFISWSPTGSSNIPVSGQWCWGIHVEHADANGYGMTFVRAQDGNIYWRRKDNNVWGAWKKIWDSDNDSDIPISTDVQSALDGKLGVGAKAVDSDKLDGLDSSQFLRSNQSDTINGNLTATLGGSNKAKIELNVSNAGSPQINLSDTDGDNYWSVGADDADNNFSIHGSTSSQPTINNIVNPYFEIKTNGEVRASGHEIWNKGNDSELVKTTGNQTIAGVKTFSSVPKTSGTPIANDDLLTKGYADTTYNTGGSETIIKDVVLAGTAVLGDCLRSTGLGTWEVDQTGTRVYDGIANAYKLGVIGGFTGLEAGFTYYFQPNGNVGLGVTPYRAGDAISSTEIDFDIPSGDKPKEFNENMVQFSFISGTVINGANKLKIELGSLADGAMIRRKTSAWVAGDNENTGDFVVNIVDDTGYKLINEWYEDTGLSAGTTYYYKAFPYKDNVYNNTIGVNEASGRAGLLLVEVTFDNVTGSVAVDDTGNNNVTLSSQIIEAGKVGNALSGAGVGYSDFNSEIDLQNKTISCWIYVNGNDSAFFGHSDDASKMFAITTGSTLRVGYRSKSDGSYKTVDVAVTNGWHHLVVKYDTSNTYLYLDNVSVGNTTYVSSTRYINRLGYADYPTRVLNGKVDQFRLFNALLTDDEISDLYNGGLAC